MTLLEFTIDDCYEQPGKVQVMLSHCQILDYVVIKMLLYMINYRCVIACG